MLKSAIEKKSSYVNPANNVTFQGRLGRDPEMSFTPGGKAITKFSIAVNQGEKKDAMWLDVVCWERLAEEVNGAVAKGNKVEVRGRLVQDSWKDKDSGKPRRGFNVVATDVTILQQEERSSGTSSGFSKSDDALGDLDEHPF